MTPPKIDLPDQLDFSTLSDKEKRELILSMKRLGGSGGAKKLPPPTTDDELHHWIKTELGYDIPRVAVCEDHTSPFEFMCDFYFERERSLLLMASREAGKTLAVAIIHYVNSVTKPGVESCTFADIEAQAKKAYSHVKSFIFESDDKGKKTLKPAVEDTLRSETRFSNGSKIEILVGSKSGVNSPHPQKVHADEVDLMEKEVWDESRNMSSSKEVGGVKYKAQDVATSTRKSTKGLMQMLVDEVNDAVSHGFKPSWKLYQHCIFENAKEVPECRGAPKDEREARLKELGQDCGKLCDCNTVVKGEWSEGVSRTLQSVCKGRFFKSRGWMEHEDVVGKFTQNSPLVWLAQMECRRPMADGLYLPTWTRERYVVRGYEPRPEYGLIWQGVDWGGSEASFVVWIQGPLHQPIQVGNTMGTKTVIPQGSYVIFKEINEAAMGATRLADKVVRQEIQYKNRFPGWRVKARFADMAGRQQREDWREHNPPLRTVWYIARDFEPTVECLQALVADHSLYIDDTNAPSLCDDFESWRMKDGKEVHDSSSHGPAAARYCLKNVTTIVKRYKRDTLQTPEPMVAARDESSYPGAIAVNQAAGESVYSSERWRESMGGPAGGNNTATQEKPAWMP